MVRADRQPVGYPADALQRAETRDWRHLTAHVDADAARTGARRPDNAHDFSDYSTARRLRTDPAWPLIARTGHRIERLGTQEHRKDRDGAGEVRQFRCAEDGSDARQFA